MDIKIKVENFKSILSDEISIKSGLNILVGPNGSGKTCIFSAATFLRDLLNKGVSQAVAKAGGPLKAFKKGKKTIKFTVSRDYGKRRFNKEQIDCEIQWSILIKKRGPDNVAEIEQESVSIMSMGAKKTTRLFEAKIIRKENRKDRQSIYFQKSSKLSKDLIDDFQTIKKSSLKTLITKFRSRFFKLQSKQLLNRDRSFFPSFNFVGAQFHGLCEQIRNLSEYNFNPDSAREYSIPSYYPEMMPDGRNVAEILYALEHKNYIKFSMKMFMGFAMPIFDENVQFMNLYDNEKGQDLPEKRQTQKKKRKKKEDHPLSEALDKIKEELCFAVKPIIDFTVKINPNTGKKYLVFKTKDNKELHPDEVSDGTIKLLCVLVSIFVPQTNFYLIEEPENFLHPWMQQRLLKIMRDESSKKKQSFLLTTHSYTILNASIADEVLTVSQSNRGTRVKKLSDKKEIVKFLEKSEFGLGDLWLSGGMEGVPIDG